MRVNLNRLVKFPDFDFDFLRYFFGAFKRLRVPHQNVPQRFLHHMVERQLISIYPKFSFKILLNDSVFSFQENHASTISLQELADKDFLRIAIKAEKGLPEGCLLVHQNFSLRHLNEPQSKGSNKASQTLLLFFCLCVSRKKAPCRRQLKSLEGRQP